MMHKVPDLTEREMMALERNRQKAELIAWLRKEAASRDGEMGWYVARTRWQSNHVAAELERHGIEAVCPTVRRWKRYPRSHKRFAVDSPLFQSYLFVHLLKAESAWVGLLSFEGIAHIQGDGERPVPLLEREVAQLIELTSEKQPAVAREVGALVVGDRVVHPLGMFAELTAIVCEIDAKRHEAIVSTMLFGREMATRCNIDDLERLA